MFIRTNQQAYHEKYFRPSKFPSINSNNLEDIISKYYKKDPAEVSLPQSLMSSVNKTIINFFNILREANQGAENKVGCGTVGMRNIPYPIAYNFLSKELKNKISYEKFLHIFKEIYHINLIKMVRIPNDDQLNNTITLLVEIETIEGTCFCYYYGYFQVQKENNAYKIKSFEFLPEDFLCAPYHYWQHNAEMKIDAMYGNWCKLIKKQYPTEKEGYFKKIQIDGTDGNKYLFTFVQLTNGTDIEVAQYKQENDKWVLVNLNPYDCLSRARDKTIEYIILPENITTGYRWQYNVEDEDIVEVMDMGYEEYEHEKWKLGVGGIHTWAIKPLKEGNTKIKFILNSPGEPSVTAETKEYLVNVYKTSENSPLFIKINKVLTSSKKNSDIYSIKYLGKGENGLHLFEWQDDFTPKTQRFIILEPSAKEISFMPGRIYFAKDLKHAALKFGIIGTDLIIAPVG